MIFKKSISYIKKTLKISKNFIPLSQPLLNFGNLEGSTKGYTEIYLISHVQYSISYSKNLFYVREQYKSLKISFKLFT